MAGESKTAPVPKDIRDEASVRDARRDDLERCRVAAEIAVTTALAAVVGAVHGLRAQLIDERRAWAEVLDHERRLARIERRLNIKSS